MEETKKVSIIEEKPAAKKAYVGPTIEQIDMVASTKSGTANRPESTTPPYGKIPISI